MSKYAFQPCKCGRLLVFPKNYLEKLQHSKYRSIILICKKCANIKLFTNGTLNNNEYIFINDLRVKRYYSNTKTFVAIDSGIKIILNDGSESDNYFESKYKKFFYNSNLLKYKNIDEFNNNVDINKTIENNEELNNIELRNDFIKYIKEVYNNEFHTSV